MIRISPFVCSVVAALSGGGVDRKNSLGIRWTPSDDFESLMQRRSSSIGFNRSNSLGLGSMDDPPRRPFVGGGAAAAYEAARADHYSSLGAQKVRSGSLSLGMGGGGGMGMSVNPNQHYEMLKLHHMNLLNEIQETTLMMNLYQQQQLQQQQQQLQQQQEASGAGLDAFSGGAGFRSSLGGMDSIGSGRASLGLGMIDKTDDLIAAQEQQKALEERLQKIKDDIARRQKEAENLESQRAKRKADGDEHGEGDDQGSKRVKKEDDDDNDNDNDNNDSDDDDDDDDDKNEEKGSSEGVGV